MAAWWNTAHALIVTALLVPLAALPAVPAAAKPSSGSGQESDKVRPAPSLGIPDRYLIKLKDPAAATADQASARLAATHHANVTHVYRTINGFAARVSAANARELSKDPAVEYVEQDAIATGADFQPYPPSWGLDRVDQPYLPLNNAYTYTGTNTGAGVHAYIVDSGLRVTHTDFGARAVIDRDFVGDGRNGGDCNGHGTHVAGTVGGAASGVAKGVRLHAVRVLDCANNGQWSQIAAGIDWVTANATRPAVMNLSIQGGANAMVDAAVNRAVAAGIPVAIAAGNFNVDACTISPARATAAITVANATSTDGRAGSSDFGPCVDLFAPGTGIVSAGIASDTQTAIMSGTSMASPHVAGAAALILQRRPSATPAQVAAEIIDGATPDVITSAGPGTPNRVLSTTCVPFALCMTATRQNPGYYRGPIVIDGRGAQLGDGIGIYYRLDGGSTFYYAGGTTADSAGRFHVTLAVPYCAYGRIDVSATSVWQDSNSVTVPSIC